MSVSEYRSELPYPLFDADNHLYETEDSLTRFLPKLYKDAIKYVQVDGRTKIAIRGQISEYIPNPTFSVVARPGAMEDYFKHGNPEGKSRREIFGKPMKSIPAFSEPGPRLELMNELGVERSLMFPTLASLIEERMRDDPALIHVVVHALNQWLDEEWGFNYHGRIFTVPVISLPIVEKAIEELDWVVSRGARAVLIRPAPVPGYRGPRSFALPEFDPFWQRCVDHDVLVAMHTSDSGYARYNAEWDGSDREMLPFQTNGMSMLNGWRPVQDAVGSWVIHGALFRHPKLKVSIIEAGSSWLFPLLNSMADVYKKAPEIFLGNPIEEIKNRIHISPFYEDGVRDLIDLIGVERVLFGSDFPHPEGLARPTHYADMLTHLPVEDQAKIMGGNLAGLLSV
jgi:predicted TIM-barrel fold metal-dependent hydrolase